ncbi:MAG TPA: von Willebrand factor type A domain-containing protein [Mucilaginibacter sp.]|nr:von Willebrand factor type A domain-containing protein [Mucilaginibacter sp.]
MKKLMLIILLLPGLLGFQRGNLRTITGTVTAKDDHLPLPGVSVIVKGTRIGIQTDSTGKYTIKVPDGYHVLSFVCVGFKRQDVNLGKHNVMNVELEASTNELREVVITGYQTQRKRNVMESVAVVSVPDASNALAGRAAGVQVQSQNTSVLNNVGAPGAASQIMIRGASSFAAAPVPNTESYSPIAENGFATVSDVPLSTFSIDVDAASYSNVRRFINNGQMPPADAVRIEEMINYFKYDLAGPTNNSPVAIHTELSSAPWNSKHRLLRIGLKAKTIEPKNLPPSNLVFLIDVSGSMDEPNKLPLVKSSMKMLVEQLRAQDKVAIVVYAGNAGLVLPSTSGDKKITIDDAIDNLSAGGSTAGGEGLILAYKIARENFIAKGNNRIVMATDGDFNVGPASDGDMEHLITKERESNVAISIMGFGMGNYKDSKMETLADKGNGNYAYIDNITEAHKALVSEFGGTLFTVAKDVKIQIEFNPAKVQAYRLLGYEDRLLAKEDFNNDKKDAGDMGSGHTVTALYEIVPAGIKDDYSGSVDPLKYQQTASVRPRNSSDEMMTIKFRYKQPESSVSKMSKVVVMDRPEEIGNTSADFKFAAAVAEFGMLLRDSQFKQQSTYAQVIDMAKEGKGEDQEGYRSEFIRLVKSARLLTKSELAVK